MEKRIKYIDGLKGICGIWICLFHYALAFFPAGYIGWESGIADADKYAHYFASFPASIFKNVSALYIFFALIAFIPALKYFRTRDDSAIKRQAVKRYFRFAPPVLACTLFSYAVFYFGGMYNQELAADLNCNWDRAFYAADLSLLGAVKNGLFDAFIHGNSDYCSVLWCMNIIFLGSYVSYAVLLMFGPLRRRWVAYAALFGLSFVFPSCAAFIAGIAAADLAVLREGSVKRKFLGEILILAGIFVLCFPPVLMPDASCVYIMLAMGAFLLISGCAESRAAQKFLSQNWLCYMGRISFAVVLVHFTVMMSLAAGIFHAMHSAGWGLWPSVAVSWGVSLPVVFALSCLFEKFIELPSEKFAERVRRLLS